MEKMMPFVVGEIISNNILGINRKYCIRKFNSDYSQVLVEPIEKIVDEQLVLDEDFKVDIINNNRVILWPIDALKNATHCNYKIQDYFFGKLTYKQTKNQILKTIWKTNYNLKV